MGQALLVLGDGLKEELWSILRSMKELGIAALASCCLTLALSYSPAHLWGLVEPIVNR